MTETTLTCPLCGAELVTAPHAPLLVCGRWDCPHVEHLPAAWAVESHGASRLPGFEHAETGASKED